MIEVSCTPYRLDCDSNAGGIFLYVREDIPSNLIATEKKAREIFFVELNLRKYKWLINCSWNLHKSLLAITMYSTYTKKMILGDFNADIQEKHMKCLPDNYNRKSLIKQSTCYKNSDSPTCLDLLLTNAP